MRFAASLTLRKPRRLTRLLAGPKGNGALIWACTSWCGAVAVDTNSEARGTPELAQPSSNPGAVRVLVTGSTGCLGPNVLEALAHHPTAGASSTYTLSRNSPESSRHYQLDITRARCLQEFLRTVRPTHIVHLAALSSPSVANLNPDLAWKTNVEAVGTLATYAKDFGARLLFASSDFVFRGDLGRAYTEADEPAPQTLYGLTKLKAEQCILHHGGMVARLSLLYPTANDPMASLARFSAVDNNLMEFRAADDEVRTPLRPRDAASAIVGLLFTELGGVFHLAGPEAITAYSLVCRQVAVAGLRTPVRRISRHSLLPPNRPHNVSLSAEKLHRVCPDLCFSKVVPSSCTETI